ncbi:Uu.00g144120.m01.CDS01 [Anthostomella pinea]|uniref:Uu.00g144120.m01.CDS01 n=1 Tax=Anthostomella pinea TaxID=933095 RepID=A0AAI8VQR8_9PEZI|nr:Uu.00g144120.m01.CDS01 [Anthostomella pinea]
MDDSIDMDPPADALIQLGSSGFQLSSVIPRIRSMGFSTSANFGVACFAIYPDLIILAQNYESNEVETRSFKLVANASPDHPAIFDLRMVFIEEHLVIFTLAHGLEVSVENMTPAKLVDLALVCRTYRLTSLFSYDIEEWTSAAAEYCYPDAIPEDGIYRCEWEWLVIFYEFGHVNNFVDLAFNLAFILPSPAENCDLGGEELQPGFLNRLYWARNQYTVANENAFSLFRNGAVDMFLGERHLERMCLNMLRGCAQGQLACLDNLESSPCAIFLDHELVLDNPRICPDCKTDSWLAECVEAMLKFGTYDMAQWFHQTYNIISFTEHNLEYVKDRAAEISIARCIEEDSGGLTSSSSWSPPSSSSSQY